MLQPFCLSMPPLGVGTQPLCITAFVDLARCKVKNCLSGIFLARLEIESVKFEEENADDKARPLVAIDKRMIADNAGRV